MVEFHEFSWNFHDIALHVARFVPRGLCLQGVDVNVFAPHRLGDVNILMCHWTVSDLIRHDSPSEIFQRWVNELGV